MARAGCAVRCEAAVRACKRFDLLAGVLKTLAKQLRRYLQGFGGIGAREIEDLAENVRETVRPIETLEHAERAADLYLLDEKRSLGISWPTRRQPLEKVV